MKTKAIKYIALSIVFILSLARCNSLDQEPIHKFTDNAFWVKPQRAAEVMNMAYNQMYKHDKPWNDELLSDNMVSANGSSAHSTIRRGLANPSTNIFKEEWKWIFEGVKTSNVFMGKVDLIPNMDLALKNRMKAEIRFIRAFLFFRLTNLYGPIPFFLEDITIAQSKTITRTPRAEVLVELHKELDEIIPMLQKRDEIPTAERGRVTQAAAAMLKARMYLQEMDMVKVEELCGRIMAGEFGTYKLFNKATTNYSAYESLFHSTNEYNDEVILDYAGVPVKKTWEKYIDMVPRTVLGSRGFAQGPTQSLVDSYITLNGLPVKGQYTYPDPYTSDPSYSEDNPYVNRDPRMDATVVYHGAVWKDVVGGAYSEEIINIRPGSGGNNEYGKMNTTTTGYYARKAFDPAHDVSLKMHNNTIIMRYADVLLMYAEAKEINGGLDRATWDKTIKPIRERAGFTLAAALDFPNDPTNMREIIRRERRSELALEGSRYFDLLRWDEGHTHLNGVLYGARFIANNSDYIRVETRVYTNRDKLWSLPQYDMDKSPGIKPNNSGY